ncbi:MAG: methyltransferase domain-containing protein [Bacteroidetes bacterium]|nr:methyltransferase domain-containing protein [Bacteroidota bacterium]
MNKKELKDIINWDVDTWSEILPYWENQLKYFDKNNAICIEIGAREGGISLWMALNGFQITCSDNYYDSGEAKKLHIKYHVEKKVFYKKVDLLDWEEKGKYDVIIMKSVLGALQTEERIKTAIENIYNNLNEDGILLFAENAGASFLHKKFRTKFTDWGKIWYYFDETSLKKMFKSFQIIDFRFNGVSAVFANRLGLSKPFSKIDKYILNKILPNKMKYMVYGYAKK